nr:SufE family protein [Entomobacter blattae]
MASSFVIPQEKSAVEAIAALEDELSLFDDWMQRYQYIIELGHTLPPYPPEWADEQHKIPGCQSQVWLEVAKEDGQLYFAGASDAAIVSGLVAMVLRVYSGRTPEEILTTKVDFLKEMGLLEALSTNRGNGIASMVKVIQETARHNLQAE